MGPLALIVRCVAGVGLLSLVAGSEALAVPHFGATTRTGLNDEHGGLYVDTGQQVPDDDRFRPVPKTLTKLVVRLPRGTKYAPKRTPVCSRDTWLRETCPKGSRVGSTVVHLIVPPPNDPDGLGAGCRTRGSIYHGRGRLFFVTRPSVFCTPLDREGLYLFEARFGEKGRLLTVDILDGPVNFFVLRVLSRALLRSPGRCPSSDRWSTRVTAHYDDRTKQSVLTRQRCRR
jgi:hypothetical protein